MGTGIETGIGADSFSTPTPTPSQNFETMYNDEPSRTSEGLYDNRNTTQGGGGAGAFPFLFLAELFFHSWTRSIRLRGADSFPTIPLTLFLYQHTSSKNLRKSTFPPPPPLLMVNPPQIRNLPSPSRPPHLLPTPPTTELPPPLRSEITTEAAPTGMDRTGMGRGISGEEEEEEVVKRRGRGRND